MALSFLMKLWQCQESFLDTFWHTEVRYVNTGKLKFLNTNHNFLTNFHTETISPFSFLNFLKWYKVKNRDGPWQGLLIDTSSTWSRGFVSKQFFVHNWHTRNVNKVMMRHVVSFLECINTHTYFCSMLFHLSRLSWQ